jgi:hypothetical protein
VVLNFDGKIALQELLSAKEQVNRVEEPWPVTAKYARRENDASSQA